MSAVVSPLRASRRRGERPEPLENGERLTASEFMRRYEAMPHLKKAELIEGIVYMPSPVRVTAHAKPDNLIQTWIGNYAWATPGVEAATNGTVKLDIENVPQPDALLRVGEECGGSSRVDEKGYLVGPPELIVEIAASSSSIDLHEKLRAYRRNGIREYLIWRTTQQAFDWFVLAEGEYRVHVTDAKGLYESVSFGGLVLNVEALVAGHGAAVLSTLRAGLKSKVHRAFVSTLASRRMRRQQDKKAGPKV